MANIPNQNFLFKNIHLGSEDPANKADKNQQAYSVTISKESLERLKKNPLLNTMNVEKQDQYRDILSKAQIDVTGTIEAEFHHRYTSLNTETYHNDMKGEDFAKNALSVYADMYDEIKRGYADGTKATDAVEVIAAAIRDTDMADEMVKHSNSNILSQAGQSMLAQANQSNQGVLSLLG